MTYHHHPALTPSSPQHTEPDEQNECAPATIFQVPPDRSYIAVGARGPYTYADLRKDVLRLVELRVEADEEGGVSSRVSKAYMPAYEAFVTQDRSGLQLLQELAAVSTNLFTFVLGRALKCGEPPVYLADMQELLQELSSWYGGVAPAQVGARLCHLVPIATHQ